MHVFTAPGCDTMTGNIPVFGNDGVKRIVQMTYLTGKSGSKRGGTYFEHTYQIKNKKT